MCHTKDKLCASIAHWLTETGLEGTTNLSYIIYFEEAADEFDLPENWFRSNAKQILAELDPEIVAEAEFDDESFDLQFYGDPVCKVCGGPRDKDTCCNCECWCD